MAEDLKIERLATRDLVERLRAIREEAGDAWVPGFIDPDVAAIIGELLERDTEQAREGLEIARPLSEDGWHYDHDAEEV